MLRFRLYTTLGGRDGHLAALVHRLRSLESAVPCFLFDPRRDGLPTLRAPDPDERHAAFVELLPDGRAELPSLWDVEAGAVIESGPLQVARRLDDIAPDESEPLRGGPADDEAVELVRSGLIEAVDAAERAGLLPSTAGTPEDDAIQRAYEAAYRDVFEALDGLAERLDHQRYLLGNERPGLADWWLFCQLVRFHPVVYELFKCNARRLVDDPALIGFVRDLYARPGVAETVEPETVKRHYYWQSDVLNPKRIVPLGGTVDLGLPHGRALRFEGRARRVGVEESGAADRDGEFVRGRSRHRDRVTADGSSRFPAAAGRYHLYVANNCPWCHRVVLTRALKGLQSVVTMDVLFYRRDPDRGWQFRPDEPGCTADTVNGVRYIADLYERVGSSESSLPVLWDRETETIVNNESAELIRMLDRAFEAWATTDQVLVPEALRAEIDALNAWIYRDVNNGAYKAGFAGSQEAYEAAYARFFAALERLDERLATRPFLCGSRLTEADVRLFPTIFRFDPVYFTRFRLDRRRVREHAHLQRWLDDMMAWPGVAAASNLEHCKRGYFGRTGNNIVPLGPEELRR